MFVSTNARFLEEDYMIENKPKSKTILEEMREKDSNDPIPSRVASTQDRGEPRRSGRVVIQPDCFIGLGEIPVGIETDPRNYNEAVQNKYATFWQKIMNTEIESMYSNQVWTLVDPLVSYGFYPNCWIDKSPDLIGVQTPSQYSLLFAKVWHLCLGRLRCSFQDPFQYPQEFLPDQ